MENLISLSMSGLILLAVTFLVLGSVGAWLLIRSKLAHVQAVCAEREGDLREAQKSIHEKERAFLEERNRIEILNADKLQEAKAAAYEQGRQFGKVEGNSQHLEEILALKADFSKKMALEVEVAVADARKRLTAEYELQTKLFTVQISPFVRISEDKGMFSSESEVETGYQYQLLVNGIPAFQPHSIVERSEVKKQVNEENVKELVAMAKDFASTAIDTYLGAGGGIFAKLAPAIVKKISKK